jgi:MFS family permease
MTAGTSTYVAQGMQDPVPSSSTAHEYTSRRTAWTITFILFTLSLISVLDRNILTLLVEPVKRHFSLTDVQMSLLIGAAFAVPYGALSIPVGWAVDRFQRRYIIAAGVTTWSFATVATGLASSFTGLFVARCFVGVGDASLGPANGSILSDVFPRNKLALPMAIASMGFKAGQGAALIAGGLLLGFIAPTAIYTVQAVGDLAGWQILFIIVGLPGLLFVPLIFMIAEPARHASGVQQDDAKSGFPAYFRFVRSHVRFFLPHHLGFLLQIAMSYTMIAWMPAFLTRTYGWSEGLAGAWLGTAFLIGPLIGMPLHGALADFLYRRGWSDIHMRYSAISVALGMPLAIAALLAPTPEMSVTLAGIYVFLISGYASLPGTALVSHLPSRLRGKAAAMLGLVCSTTGTILGPLMVGVVTDVVFRDPKMVGYSIMTCIIVLAPLVVVLMAASLKPLRQMAAEGH